MRFNLSKSAGRLSAVGIVVLFPGFFVYHTLLSWGVIPPFIAGLFGPASAALAVAFAVMMLRLLPALVREGGVFVVMVFVCIVYVGVWTVAHYIGLAGIANRVAVSQSFEMLVMWYALYMVGCYLAIDSKYVIRAFGIFFWIALGFVLYQVVATGSVMYYARRSAYDSSFVASYQGFARSALVVAMFLSVVKQSAIKRALIVLLGCVLMFILGARSEMFGFMFGVTALMAVLATRSIRDQVVLMCTVSGIVAMSFFALDHIETSRQLELFSMTESSSWNERQRLSALAVDQIIAQPVVGSFGSHITEQGETGYHAHNVLSAWVNYGVVGFVLYLGLSVAALFGSMYRVCVQGSRESIWLMAFVFNLVILLLIILVKGVFWPLTALGWGLYTQAVLSEKRHPYRLNKQGSIHVDLPPHVRTSAI